MGKKRNVCSDTYTCFPCWVSHLPAPLTATALLISMKQGELPGKTSKLKILSGVFILFIYFYTLLWT